MKTSSKIFHGIGVLLVVLQYFSYKGNGFRFPALHHGSDFATDFKKNLGIIVGYNFFGLVGILLIVISILKRKKPI